MNKCCPTHCPFTGVHIARFLATLLGVFAFTWAYDYALHVKVLMSIYEQTPQLWRTEADMLPKIPFSIFVTFATAFVITFIFTRGYQGTGLMEGVRYGILIGLFMGLMMTASYGWMPISGTLALAWYAGGLFKGIGSGIICAAIYRK